METRKERFHLKGAKKHSESKRKRIATKKHIAENGRAKFKPRLNQG